MTDEPLDPFREHDQVAEAAVIIQQARQVALYHQTLKEAGKSDYDALTLTRDWLAESFETGSD